mmetsp:Transcript_15481/g.21995  ORF Transcript_15481/g.21995 Transcript_15481/m.21995 type:complete len:413 (+) Transcript_15481:85-1323(+)
MSNAQDLLSILGGGAPRPAPRANPSSTEKTILSFKAGKMNTELQPNGKYMVSPDNRRGEINLVWTTTNAAPGSSAAASGGSLTVQWKDRRTMATVNTYPIFPSDNATFERVETGNDVDRVYLLSCGANNADSRHFFWMQDKENEPDEDNCVNFNLYMSNNAEAARAAGASAPASSNENEVADDNAELLRIMQGALGSQGAGNSEGARTVDVPGDSSIPTASVGQIDALGNILENLGMPQPGAAPSGEINATSSSSAGNTGGLTLADLQGAMAGLATASPNAASAGPPLSEFTSSDIIDESGILNDSDVTARLVALLPEGQQTEDKLRENIRSPQVAQCLQRLQSALADDAGSFNSIIANFQLDPTDGAAAMGAGNPIEAFLNCLIKDVERKGDGKKSDEGEEEAKDDGMDES